MFLSVILRYRKNPHIYTHWIYSVPRWGFLSLNMGETKPCLRIEYGTATAKSHAEWQCPQLIQVQGEAQSCSWPALLSAPAPFPSPPPALLAGSRCWKGEPVCCYHCWCPQQIQAQGSPRATSDLLLAPRCRGQLCGKSDLAGESGSTEVPPSSPCS